MNFLSHEKKTEILKGRGGLRLWNSEGMGGNAFWNFRRQVGVKIWKPSVVGYGYFLELPILKIVIAKRWGRGFSYVIIFCVGEEG